MQHRGDVQGGDKAERTPLIPGDGDDGALAAPTTVKVPPARPFPYHHEWAIDPATGYGTDRKSDKTALSIGRLLRQAYPERWMLLAAFFSLMLAAASTLIVPAIVGAVIDIISKATGADTALPHGAVSSSVISRLIQLFGFPNTAEGTLKGAILLLFVVICISSLFAMLRGYLFTLAGVRVVSRLRERLFSAVVKQEVGFFDGNRTGELLNRLSADTQLLKDVCTTTLGMALRFVTNIIGGIVINAAISWKLTLLMLAVVPLVAIAAKLWGGRLRALSKDQQDALAKATEAADETLANIRTVRSFAREGYQSDRYGDAVFDTYAIGKRYAWAYATFIALIGFVGVGSIIFILWFGAQEVLKGQLSAGGLTTFLLYSLQIGGALAGVSELYTSIVKAVGANTRVFELIDRKPEIAGGDVRVPDDAFKGHVRFDEVCFAYPTRPEQQVLTNLSLELKPGTVTALVGASGGGKSTCVALLERFYDVGSGRVLLDGRDVKTLDADWLRRQIGLVAQEPCLFAGTIRDNLAFGCHTAVSDADIEAAARQAHAWGFIQDFPDGLDTMVGERGVRLSGGQKQRCCIARAILANPRILLLDESTSALDANSEHLVQRALDTLMEGRTSLVVAHRLSTVRGAHNVVVVQAGRVVEQGTHEDLLARPGGAYVRLVERQLEERRDERQLEERRDGGGALPTAAAAAAS